MVATITREELQATIERGDDVILVEAQPVDVYDQAHLPGAVNLPFETDDQIAELAAGLLPDTAADIIVYCSNSL